MHKKAFMATTFVLALLLLLALTSPVKAQESYSRILFGCEVAGHGLVVWGGYVVAGGNPVVHHLDPAGPEILPEYVEELDKSTMQFSGTSDKLTYYESGFFGLSCYLFEEAKILGTLTAKWTTDDGESHMLHIVLDNTEEAGGLYASGTVDSNTYVYYLLVGFTPQAPPPGGPYAHPSPKDAALIFKGVYKDGDGVKKISGRGFLVAVDAEVDEERVTRVHWNLWVEELQTYVAFLWSTSEYMLNWAEFMEPQYPLAMVPATRVYKAHIKLI